MAKFNVVQKKRRALLSERKRAIHGDPLSGKLKVKPQPVSISGKRKRKLLKQWRREQKVALEKGLITIQDVEMALTEAADANKEAEEKPSTSAAQLRLKKRLKIKATQLNNRKGRGGGKKKGKQVAEAQQVETMIE
ncbi:uncharacterized protein LOC124927385 isoform X1 [Impatiens glandulifera]|uniref:uncharacterized protein LOC124927385 isoform X1 n=1 Tax=Impatiens glandulifera TaxID=253017 RepID=UPI001FB14F04|nr:uncharacterized protein LOC124927385 isoform X1 [Impatiens glandulifera]